MEQHILELVEKRNTCTQMLKIFGSPGNFFREICNVYHIHMHLFHMLHNSWFNTKCLFFTSKLIYDLEYVVVMILFY